jgi:hypothetical protein
MSASPASWDGRLTSNLEVGWMYGDLYRLLDGSAQQYVILSTPPKLEVCRQQLRGKLIELDRVPAQ